MLELQNQTPFPAAIVPGLDKEGRDTFTVVIKGTYALGRSEALAVADAQVPIAYADVFHGEPGVSSIRYEADACPAKKGTDVVLVGHARSVRPVPSLDVSLSAGRLRKVVRVFGDRVWFPMMGRAAISDPIAFARMPLVYERAFGGGDLSVDDAAARPRDPRNPVGAGFTSATEPERVEGVRLPNLEDPAALIASPGDRPAPAGFGFIGRDWLPRRAFAGTYDDAWQADRMPFLPADFDERYFNAAHPGLTSPRPFRGGEPVQVTNASEGGELRFQVPGPALQITARIRRVAVDLPATLDTLLIEPDAQRVVVTWRATAPCPRSFLYIERVRIAEEGGVRQPLAITGTSAVTAVGADVEQTCAAIRAGIRAGREHAWFRTEGWDPEWDPTEPLLAVPVRDVDPTLDGPERLLHLIVPALADLVKSARLRRADLAECALLLALPEADEAVEAWRLSDAFVPALCQKTGLTFKVTRVSRAGRAGGLALLEEASALIGSREVQSAIVAGVDSYLSGDRLALLDGQHRLKSQRNVDGFIPGEAASAIYLEAPGRAAARRVPVLATVTAVGLGHEPQTLRGDRGSSGSGLTTALRAVVPERARWVLCDLNGESYRSFEWGVIRSRVGAPLGDVARLVHPAASLGDVGAATGGVLVACVAAAFQRGYAAADEAVLWASADGAARAAARIERAR